MFEEIKSFINQGSWRELPTGWKASGSLFYYIIAASFIVGFLLGGGWTLGPDIATNREALYTPYTEPLADTEQSPAPALQASEEIASEPTPPSTEPLADTEQSPAPALQVLEKKAPEPTPLSALSSQSSATLPSVFSFPTDDTASPSDLIPDDNFKTASRDDMNKAIPFQTASIRENHGEVNAKEGDHKAQRARQGLVNETANHLIPPDKPSEVQSSAESPDRLPVQLPPQQKSSQEAKSPSPSANGHPSPSDPVYAVQIGAFLEKANARSHASDFRARGYDPFILSRPRKNRLWHRVFVKRLTRRTQAKAMASAIKASEQVDAYVLRLDALASGTD